VLKRIHLIFDEEMTRSLNPVRAADMKLSFRPKNLWAETKTRSAASPLKKLHYVFEIVLPAIHRKMADEAWDQDLRNQLV
jgi:hypothetical protein